MLLYFVFLEISAGGVGGGIYNRGLSGFYLYGHREWKAMLGVFLVVPFNVVCFRVLVCLGCNNREYEKHCTRVYSQG